MAYRFSRGPIFFVVIVLLLSVSAFAKSGPEGEGSSVDDVHARLIGPDANKNLVRDDIDDYIDKNYPDAREHAAMIQFAQAYERLLLDGNTVAGTKHATAGVVRAVQCGINVFGGSHTEKQKAVLAMMLDSEERFEAYGVARRNEEGLTFERFSGDPCLR